MLKFHQMTGRGLANAAGQAVAMRCVRGRSAVTKAAPPGPLCCILWAFSRVAPLRADGNFTVKLLFWQRPPLFSGHFRGHGALHSCATCQLSEHHSYHGAAASTICYQETCRICQSCCSRPPLVVQPHAAMH